MKAIIENGKIQLDYCEVFENLNIEEKRFLVQSLACDDDIVRYVVDQILEGWTEDGYHGGRCGDEEIHTSSPLDMARRRIALGAGKVAKETIEAQQKALTREKESCSMWVRKYHDLNDKLTGFA